MDFTSRRSSVMGRKGVVASSQPLASASGAQILRAGGKAVDAAVAIAAALAVTEPCSTGIGGDAFALYFDAKTGKTTAILGNGATPVGYIKPLTSIRPTGPEAVTVPGAAACWVDLVEKFGTKPLEEVLEPAIALAEDGFPVSKLTAGVWKQCEEALKQAGATTFLVDGQRAPEAGEVFYNLELGAVLRDLGKKGKDGFYGGRVGAAICEAIQSRGGCLTTEDLLAHKTIFTEPISTDYRGIRVYEVPPPTQGIAALMALNIAQGFDLKEIAGHEHNSGAYLHTMVNCMRLAFSDVRAFVADPDTNHVPTKELLSAAYASQRRQEMGATAFYSDIAPVDLAAFQNPDTVQFCAVDAEGNACSMINSNFVGFGSLIIPTGCGFSLHNRGLNFSCDPSHPNCFQAGKKPYHTIIPAMAVKDGKLFAAFGVMGGFMQPQGHFQVFCNLVDWSMDPQAALDAPRFRVGDAYTGLGPQVFVEEGVDARAIEELERRKHVVIGPVRGARDRQSFGRGQIIRYHPETRVAEAGSDPRSDGMAIAI